MNVADATSIAGTFCSDRGIAASPERLAVIGEALAGAVEWDATAGRHFVLDTEGNRIIRVAAGEVVEIDPVTWLAELTKSDPRRAARKPVTPAQAQTSDPAAMVRLEVGTSTGYRRADNGFARVVGALKAADDAATARKVATWANPWIAGQINRTHQAVIGRTNPTLAAQMKRAAGINS